MEDKQGDREETESAASATAATTQAPPEPPAARPEAPDEQAPPRPPPGRSGVLALVLSLLALALAGWLFYERFSLAEETLAAETLETAAAQEDLAAVEDRLDELTGQLAAQRNERQQLLDRHEAMAQQTDRLGEQVAALEGQMESRLAQLEADLERRAAQWSEEFEVLERQLGASVDAWAVRGDQEQQAERDLQRQIAMLEAAALLRIGQERAELVSDLAGAQLAYRRADAHLSRIDDVRLDRVRRSIASELESLENVRSLDLGRSLARLDRLARDSRSWPTQLGAGEIETQPATVAEGDGSDTWRARVAGAARGLVRVQARDDLGRTEEQFEAARELLQLRLVAAQLALTRRDAEALGLQLSAATELLDEWFDSSSEAVRQARVDLGELAEVRFEQDLPELGEALNRLQTLLGGS